METPACDRRAPCSTDAAAADTPSESDRHDARTPRPVRDSPGRQMLPVAKGRACQALHATTSFPSIGFYARWCRPKENKWQHAEYDQKVSGGQLQPHGLNMLRRVFMLSIAAALMGCDSTEPSIVAGTWVATDFF